jgi:hypothetical protein
MVFWMSTPERIPQVKWPRIRIEPELHRRLKCLRDAWTGVNRRRLSVNNVVEILVQLVPGKLTDEEIASVELHAAPPGRPRKRVDVEEKGA